MSCDTKNKDGLLYWVWVQQIIGYGSSCVKFFIDNDISARDFYENGKDFWLSFGMFRKKVKQIDSFSLNEASKILDECYKSNIEVITYEDKRYPALLKKIDNPPCLVYAKGNLDCLVCDIPVSVVGSRAATYYGVKIAYNLAYDLSKNNCLVTSGGALGIDTAAHQGALDADGSTVAILPCGINFKYLMTNEKLREKISRSGVLLSEYAPDHPMKKFNFHLRNRLISGISLGTIVVEAGKHSGAMITANLAIEQNRDVFVTPILAQNPLSEGIFALINDGARVIKSGKDISEYYKFNKLQNLSLTLMKNNTKTNIGKNKNTENFKTENTSLIKNLTENEKLILGVLKESNCSIEKIKEDTNLNVSDIFSSITKMEIRRIIKKLPGKIYKINTTTFDM
ncbi:MAG: DNA-protecting protein DprA [Candidatus Improbicoccus pseudotrichonymphae]|uniref:DNA-protecting protein DprA n=1 Tax=Candidatus Improbicoccus pseudotrichonymphae TaxID=3033792 RepID=A0AA48HYD9_9FIRM|nr:MAG: DNA-protecting protein DprA [Candidatus Improbicoccus pseudotrichonymphae]